MTESIYILLWVSAIVFILSGLDDLYIDISYWIFRNKYKINLPDMNEIKNAPEHPFALVIGCWQEYPVIARTISLALNKVKYTNYKIFIGVYQNDPKTIKEVKKFSDIDSRVIMCINPKNGPTSKADNLNNVFNCIKQYEETYGEFGVVLIHDSEDFIHPMSFKLFNYLIMFKGYYAVQIPVVPIKSSLGKLLHRTYCDSFAETHTKDIVVRQSLGSFVPFAGTGMGFNRVAFKYLETHNPEYLEILRKRITELKNKKYNFRSNILQDQNDDVLFRTPIYNDVNIKYIYGDLQNPLNIFNDANLTEDYEMGLKFHKLGLQVAFVNLIVREENDDYHIATKSYFPNGFWPAVKQRSRWIAGINLQNWKIHQWKGSLITKYFLIRDRKGIFNNIFLLISFLLLFYALLSSIDQGQGWNIFKPVLEKYSILYYFLISVMFFFAVRSFHRFFFTYQWYGFQYAFMSLFRMFADNAINFFASLRAIKIFYNKKNVLVWDKTEHY